MLVSGLAKRIRSALSWSASKPKIRVCCKGPVVIFQFSAVSLISVAIVPSTLGRSRKVTTEPSGVVTVAGGMRPDGS